jgi:HK97 family phage prohead protease
MLPANSLLLTKGLAAKAAPSSPRKSGDRVRRFVLSDEVVDRDGDIVLVSGINTSEYERNPIVLWAHRFDLPPIGRMERLHKEAGRLVGDVRFASTEDADKVLRLVDGGFLNATSVGFRTVRSGPPSSLTLAAHPEAARKCIRVIYECLLLEVSIVPIPSNPGALRMDAPDAKAVAAGVMRKIAADPIALKDLAAEVAGNVFAEVARRGGVRR